MLKSTALLKRWIDATGGDLPYPNSPDQIGLDLTVRLQMQDPELLQILQGNAPARLELAVLDGSLADAAPTQQQRQDASKAQRIAELIQANPFGTAGYYQGDEFIEPTPGNVTAAFELAALDPELAAKLEAAAAPAVGQAGLSPEGANFVNSRLFASHIAGAR